MLTYRLYGTVQLCAAAAALRSAALQYWALLFYQRCLRKDAGKHCAVQVKNLALLLWRPLMWHMFGHISTAGYRNDPSFLIVSHTGAVGVSVLQYLMLSSRGWSFTSIPSCAMFLASIDPAWRQKNHNRFHVVQRPALWSFDPLLMTKCSTVFISTVPAQTQAFF